MVQSTSLTSQGSLVRIQYFPQKVNNMKILIFGDVHGRDFWKEPCKNIDKFDKIIFLGDYHDPYPKQISERKSRHLLRDELVPFIEANQDKVICIKGNHDCCYLHNTTKCRFDNFHREEIKNLLERMNLKLAYKIDNYIFSHSGILPLWLEINEITLDDVLSERLNKYHLDQISKNRGGYDKVGSCVWGDLDEYYYSRKLEDYYQIFGHTQIQKEYIGENFACLDCSKGFVLDTETKTLTEYNKLLYDE